MSYHEVSILVRDETGRDLLSSQRIQAIVVEEARRLRTVKVSRARAPLERGNPCPAINQKVALYDEQREEILLFDDGIQVKKQKATREKPSERLPPDALADSTVSKAKVHTEVLMVQRAQGDFPYIRAGLDGDVGDGVHVRAEELVRRELIRDYGERTEPLNLGAITDGARNSRRFRERVFGMVILISLDWYHLEKKVGERMRLSAGNTPDKQPPCRELLSCLWEGQVENAREYLRSSISPRQKKKQHELST